MNSTDTETMNALQPLLDERQRYEGWLRTLNERRDSTPTHVFERVLGDYTKRLDSVRSRLSEHTEQLRTTIATMTAKLDELRTRESDRIDARSEGELRAAVGEFSDEEWTQIRDEADLEIEIMGQEREELESELLELQNIVASSDGSETSGTASVSAAEATSTPVATASSANAPATASAAQPESVETSNSTSNGATSGSAQNTSQHTSQNPERSGTGSFERAPSLDDFVDWPARRESLETAEQGDGIPRAPEVADNMTGGTSASSNAPRPHGNSRKTPPGGVPTQSRSGNSGNSGTANTNSPVAEPPRRDAEKSLKCPECGALNYATEWYCERCGGELATF